MERLQLNVLRIATHLIRFACLYFVYAVKHGYGPKVDSYPVTETGAE